MWDKNAHQSGLLRRNGKKLAAVLMIAAGNALYALAIKLFVDRKSVV